VAKSHRSNTRKTISFLGKAALVCMGEPIPTQKQPASSKHQSHRNNQPIFLKLLIFILKIPLFLFIAGATHKKSKQPSLQEVGMGEPMIMSNDYYIPEEKH